MKVDIKKIENIRSKMRTKRVVHAKDMAYIFTLLKYHETRIRKLEQNIKKKK